MPRIRKALQPASAVVWRHALYIRLSREDYRNEGGTDGKSGAGTVAGQDTADASRSIIEQKKMLYEYVETHFVEEDYVIVDTYMDDGLTGTDDTRDDFRRMMRDVDTGKVNCIIVKTLSRAFRNYADQGRYLEQVFPSKGVRFISISNPFVDSFKDPDAIQNGMEIPINGLMNDRFAAKTSADVRRTFDAKRKRGEFIGGFAPYGYAKDPQNKNRLVVDGEAARVVRDIYAWFVNDGMSKAGVAKRLNDLGIPNPSAYKNHVQHLSFRVRRTVPNDGYWSGSQVLKVLTNEVYIGNMVQGTKKVISYKVHKQIKVPKSEWYVVPGTHDAIIDRETFEKAQSLHKRDMRAAPGKRDVYLFSGYVRCADCKSALRRKKAKEYAYYSCRTKTEKGTCSTHSIREDRLEQAVLDAIRAQIALVESWAAVLDTINQSADAKPKTTRLNAALKLRGEELEKITSASADLYIDWKSGEITKDDYRRMKTRFDEKTQRLTEAIQGIQAEIETMAKGVTSADASLRVFLAKKNIEALERGVIVELIDTIYVHEDGQLTIDFSFADELKRVADFIANNHRELSVIGNEVAS